MFICFYVFLMLSLLYVIFNIMTWRVTVKKIIFIHMSVSHNFIHSFIVNTCIVLISYFWSISKFVGRRWEASWRKAVKLRIFQAMLVYVLSLFEDVTIFRILCMNKYCNSRSFNILIVWAVPQLFLSLR